MKKKIVTLAMGVVALGGLVYLSTQLGAQQPGQPGQPTRAQTRIAVMNIQYVVKNYKRYQDYEASMKARMEQYKKREEAYRNQMTALAADMKKAVTPADKERLQASATQIKRQLEDLAAQGNKELATSANKEVQKVYQEIRSIAQRYAVSQGFEMVLHFSDELANSPEYDSSRNILTKLHSKAMLPLYVHPSMDISKPVVDYLNAGYKPATNNGN